MATTLHHLPKININRTTVLSKKEKLFDRRLLSYTQCRSGVAVSRQKIVVEHF